MRAKRQSVNFRLNFRPTTLDHGKAVFGRTIGLSRSKIYAMSDRPNINAAHRLLTIIGAAIQQPGERVQLQIWAEVFKLQPFLEDNRNRQLQRV